MAFLLGSLLLLSVFAGACHKMPLGSSGQGAQDGRPVEIKRTPLDEARLAYANADFKRAESLSLKLVEGKSLSGDDSAEAGRILAAAALNNKHPNVALQGLDHWRKVAKGADNGKEWQDAWCKTLRSLSSHDARTRANALYQDSSRGLLPRCIAGVALAARQWQDGEAGQSMTALENIYSTATNTREKAAIEGRLAIELGKSGSKAVDIAAASVNDGNRGRFPYNIIYIEKLRRQSRNPSTKEEASRALAAFASGGGLADSSLYTSVPAETDIRISAPANLGSGASGASVSGQPVVLALPLSGQYGKLSAKIVNGAQVACDEMSSGSNKVSLIVIDTDKADWLAKADALPAEATVIGGPLRRADYQKAKSAGLASRRVLLTFLASLDSGDEGRTAWRFFSSAKDQVDSLLNFTSNMGVKSYGVLYPADSFGERMTALFEERAGNKGATKIVKSSYDPANQTGWATSVRNLLDGAKGQPFKAVFLPDSWKNMDTLVPSLYYYKEERQILMGTSLWEQSLSGGAYVSGKYYGRAVFPGAWNASNPPPAGVKLQAALAAAGKGDADFWSGLGYDFARASVRMGVRQGWNPGTVNSALASASSINWSTAPISWSGGLASQKMFLFSPKENGFALVDERAFRSGFEAAWAK